MIPYGRQSIVDDDIQAVINVLQSDFLTQGPAVPQFEQAVAKSVGASFAVAMNSATSALHVACLALKLGPGDTLWTVPNTFVASANCALYCGAKIDFIDINSRTWNMSIDALEERLIQARKKNALPKIVVPVHFAGQPTDQQAIRALSDEYGFKIIEDASHSIGASRDGESVGSCRWSDVTIFSFHPVKIITSGEGGMALTNDRSLATLMSMLRTHGITRDAALFKDAAAGAFHYEQQMLGFNYRMTDLHAALGASQMQRLEIYVERRNVLAQRYDAALKDLPLELPFVDSRNCSAFHLYVTRMARDRDLVFAELRSRGVGVNVHYTPVHLQPYYRDIGFGPGLCPEAEAHGREALTLPLYPTLTECQQDEVIQLLMEML